MSTSSSAAWTVLAEHVHVRQSRAYWMNSTVLLDSEHTILVDPGVLPSELDEIARLVNQAEPEQVTIIFTHGHWDHVLGAPWWPKARIVAHDRCGPEMIARLDHIRREAEALAAERGEPFPQPFVAPEVHDASSGQRLLKLDPWRLVLRDAPGHSDSQLTVHVPELELLIAADMLSDIEIPILHSAPAVYRSTLEALRPLAEGGAFEALIPGHGSIALDRDEVVARLKTDLAYLDALEGGMRDARRDGLTFEAARAKLATMEYTGKHSESYPTTEMHEDNMKLAWEAAR